MPKKKDGKKGHSWKKLKKSGKESPAAGTKTVLYKKYRTPANTRGTRPKRATPKKNWT